MSSFRRWDGLKFFMFIAPWLIGFTIFFLIPLSTAVYYAFTDARIPGATSYNFIGFDNFTFLLKDPVFIKSTTNTLYFVFVGVPIVVCGMLMISLLLNMNVRGIAIFRTFYYLPTLVPIVATVIIWRLVFNSEFGVLNAFLDWFGIDKVNWLGGESTIKPVIILLQIWISGSGVLIFLAALKGVPGHLYEAARIDGAGRIRSFFSVTIPMISPSILFVVVIQIMYNFQIFSEALLLSNGGPNYASYTYVFNIYKSAFNQLQYGRAMAQSMFLFVLIFAVTLVVLKSSNRYVYYEGEQKKGGR